MACRYAVQNRWTVAPSRRRLVGDPDAEDLFALWHHEGLAYHAVAVAVTTAGGRTAVVTHAGVTQPFWRRWLGSTLDPVAAVYRINDLPLAVVHQPGRMLGFQEPAVDVDFGYDDVPDDDVVVVRRANVPVGPIWADTTELWSSWLDVESPRRQVHGHTSAWFRNDWSPHAPPEAVPYATRDQRLRHTRYLTARGKGFPLLGIECSVWAAPNLVLHPLVIPNAQVVGV